MSKAIDRLGKLEGQLDGMVEGLRDLVEAESPSDDPQSCRLAGNVLAKTAKRLLGTSPRVIDVDERQHLLWHFGPSIDVLIVGHIDTVFPLGTLSTRPFTTTNGRASGPGVYDMKSGLIQSLYAIASLDDPTGVCLLVTDDEEMGSPTSKELVTELAASAAGALVVEGAAGDDRGLVKTARRGYSTYEIEIQGRPAHAGMNPADGVNALIELAHIALAVAQLGSGHEGSTVTPTVARSGGALNVIPDSAVLKLDVRMTSPEEQVRIGRAIHALTPCLQGASLKVRGGANRPPMPESASHSLFAIARAAATELGLDPLGGMGVGGGSDACFIAPLGVPVLDGLGGIGGNAHQADEWVDFSRMPERAALLASVIDEVLRWRRANALT